MRCDDVSHARLRLDLTGAVQGVGFRPFVYRLAISEGLGGFVRNTGNGVCIEIEGATAALDRFVARLPNEMPPHAWIDTQRATALPAQRGDGFTVAPSSTARVGTAVVMTDLATCADCLREILDPTDRRYRYPFTTCVCCGPRYSIIEALPYDRDRTTMRRFPLCAACRREYTDPSCRRFHAESIACRDCGPRLSLWDRTGATVATDDSALLRAVAALRDGQILALKGLGGFQLLADAENAGAVTRLRQRKRRPRKPFALMAPSLEAAERIAWLDDEERRVMASSASPIMLARRRMANGFPGVAPDTGCLGVMLPTTPLHHLLLRALGRPVVATSGNVTDEPIVTDNDDALRRLGGIGDLFLVHDRPILRGVDDSVLRVMAGQPVVLRRARGYAPMPIPHEAIRQPMIALGGAQKTAIAMGDSGRLFLGPHIGDLDTALTRTAFEQATETLPPLLGIVPATLACDRHPDYPSTQYALGRTPDPVRVPHHLAHVLAAMVDNALAGPVLGVAWDGTGYGGDGTIWGGEFLRVAGGRYCRVGHLLPFRLPGGEAAIREPRRAALGLLEALGDQMPPTYLGFTASESAILARMLARGFNAPLTSSAGRLFDAIAALLGLCQVNSFEGEAAMMLECAADQAEAPYPLPPATLHSNEVDWRPPVAELLRAHRDGVAPAPLAAGLHDALAGAIVSLACHAGIADVVLTGGCFQNARLTTCTVSALRNAGFTPYWHRRIPPNDGGLAAGQLAFAACPLTEEAA